MAVGDELSNWRGFREPIVPARPIRRSRKHSGLDMFYGYPAELIVERCCVALSTRPSSPTTPVD
jgi:hypothetical protein